MRLVGWERPPSLHKRFMTSNFRDFRGGQKKVKIYNCKLEPKNRLGREIQFCPWIFVGKGNAQNKSKEFFM